MKISGYTNMRYFRPGEKERDKASSISPLPEGTIKSEVSHLSLEFMCSAVFVKYSCEEHQKGKSQRYCTCNFLVAQNLILNEHCLSGHRHLRGLSTKMVMCR